MNALRPSTDPPSTPKAYLNWMLLDEQLKCVSGQSGVIAVVTSGTLTSIGITGLTMSKSGFLYVWVSNETPNWDVFFDNLSVKHYTGPMLEETHYYPFGLTMTGISSSALKTKYAINNFKFGGKEIESKEFSDGTSLELYDFGSRFLDPQLGIWHSIDPHSDNSRRISGYVYANDNPLRFIDPDGMDATSANDADKGKDDEMVNYVTVRNVKTGKETNVVTGTAEKGAKEVRVTGINGGAGQKFSSADQAAFAWGVDNAKFANSKEVEHAGSIYMEKRNGQKTFSYNGSYRGSNIRSDYHDRDKNSMPAGAIVVALIQPHPTDNDFSKHTSFDDRNQYLDEDAMTTHDDLDFYLVNPAGQLLVNRHKEVQQSMNAERGETVELAHGLLTPKPFIKTSNWHDANGEQDKNVGNELKIYKH